MCLIKWVYIIINYTCNENKIKNRSHRDDIKRPRRVRCEHRCSKYNIMYYGAYVLSNT